MGIKCWELFVQIIQGAGVHGAFRAMGRLALGEAVANALKGSAGLRVRAAALGVVFRPRWARQPCPCPFWESSGFCRVFISMCGVSHTPVLAHTSAGATHVQKRVTKGTRR